MNMLLTASGIKNDTIKSALEDMLGKPFGHSRVVYISTATTVEEGDHSWFMDSLSRLYQLGWKEFNVMELNGVPKANLVKRL